MKRLSVTVSDEFFEDVQELSRRMNAPIAGLVRYALDRAFYDELDEIFCERRVKVFEAELRASCPEVYKEENSAAPEWGWQEYRNRHDWRMAKVMEFLETLPYVNP
jgi:hypothetical protein